MSAGNWLLVSLVVLLGTYAVFVRSFAFGQVQRNNTKGTAKLTTTVPGPGELVLAQTKQVKGDEARAVASGGASARTSQNEIEVKLTVRPRGKGKKKLNRKGKAKVKGEGHLHPQRQRSDHRWKHRRQDRQADQAVGPLAPGLRE